MTKPSFLPIIVGLSCEQQSAFAFPKEVEPDAWTYRLFSSEEKTGGIITKPGDSRIRFDIAISVRRRDRVRQAGDDSLKERGEARRSLDSSRKYRQVTIHMID
jgi:hypothetical protein